MIKFFKKYKPSKKYNLIILGLTLLVVIYSSFQPNIFEDSYNYVFGYEVNIRSTALEDFVAIPPPIVIDEEEPTSPTNTPDRSTTSEDILSGSSAGFACASIFSADNKGSPFATYLVYRADSCSHKKMLLPTGIVLNLGLIYGFLYLSGTATNFLSSTYKQKRRNLN